MYFIFDAPKSVSYGVHFLSTLIAFSKFLKRFASPFPPSLPPAHSFMRR
jgi:hypothetical protein